MRSGQGLKTMFEVLVTHYYRLESGVWFQQSIMTFITGTKCPRRSIYHLPSAQCSWGVYGFLLQGADVKSHQKDVEN